MKYLCDTNIFFQVLRKRAFYDECLNFFNEHVHEAAMTDFSLFTLCVKAQDYDQEVSTYRFMLRLLDEGISVLRVAVPEALAWLLERRLSSFDFDDFLQYSVAKKNELTLITLDHDFFKKNLDIPVLRPDQVK